jgi:hypothetical protein
MNVTVAGAQSPPKLGENITSTSFAGWGAH